MTPAEIEEAVRRRYNSVSDNFWASDEINQLIYDACQELVLETNCIERIYTTTTVSGTQEYAMPTNVIAIKRITYNGQKLKPINMREDDALTGLNQTLQSLSSPSFYWMWNYTLYLRPIPDAALELKLWTYNQHPAITSTSIIEVPTEFHMKLCDYIVAEMAAKDSNPQATKYYMERWERAKLEIKKWMRMRKRADAFGNVQNEEDSVGSYLGMV